MDGELTLIYIVLIIQVEKERRSNQITTSNSFLSKEGRENKKLSGFCGRECSLLYSLSLSLLQREKNRMKERENEQGREKEEKLSKDE